MVENKEQNHSDQEVVRNLFPQEPVRRDHAVMHHPRPAGVSFFLVLVQYLMAPAKQRVLYGLP